MPVSIYSLFQTLFHLTESVGNRGNKIYCTNKTKFRSLSPSLLVHVQNGMRSHNSFWCRSFLLFFWTGAPWNFHWNDTFHLMSFPMSFTLAQLGPFKIWASLIDFRNLVLGTLFYKIPHKVKEKTWYPVEIYWMVIANGVTLEI